MFEFINLVMAVATFAFGLFGFLAPRYTLSALDLTTTTSTMGLSEMRSTVGGLFIALGIAAMFINDAWIYVAIGIAMLGTVGGRVLSALLDKPPMNKLLMFGVIETGMAVWLLAANAGNL